MVVYGPKTKEAALQMVRQHGNVFYSDKYIYSAVVSSPEALDDLLRCAFDRGDIAIIGLEKTSMEYYTTERKKVMQQRHLQEIKDMRAFVKSHKKEIAKIVQRNERLKSLGLVC